MKRVLFMLLAITLCLSALSGCATKIEEPSGADKVVITKYDVASESDYATSITVEADEQIKHICENLSSLKLKKMDYNKPTEKEYQLVFYSSGKEMQTISVTAHGWIDYEGDFYQVTGGALDLAYIASLLDPACEHNWERTSNENESYAVDTCSKCGKTRTYTETDQSPENDMDPKMEIGKEFSVIAIETLTIPVYRDNVRTDHTARVAALKDENGDHALYLDVLTQDNQVLSSVTWRGYYQLFMNSEGTLILLNVSAFTEMQCGTVLYQLYTVSDMKMTAQGYVELESPQINVVVGDSFNYDGDPSSMVANYKHQCIRFMHSFKFVFRDQVKDGHEVYMIADSYLNPATPVVYSNTQKVPTPDFTNNEISSKYTINYIAELIG